MPLSPPARVPLHRGVGCASWRVPLPIQDQQAPPSGSGQVCRADGGAAGAQSAAEQQGSVSGAAEALQGRYRGWPFGTTLPQQESVRSQVGDTTVSTVTGNPRHSKPCDVARGWVDPMNTESRQSRMQQTSEVLPQLVVGMSQHRPMTAGHAMIFINGQHHMYQLGAAASCPRPLLPAACSTDHFAASDLGQAVLVGLLKAGQIVLPATAFRRSK